MIVIQRFLAHDELATGEASLVQAYDAGHLPAYSAGLYAVLMQYLLKRA